MTTTQLPATESTESVDILCVGAGRAPSATWSGGPRTTDILENDYFQAGAKRMAIVIHGYGGAVEAVAALEALASDRTP
jgi:hypothetical protein